MSAARRAPSPTSVAGPRAAAPGRALSARTPPILHRRSTVRKTDPSWAPPSRHMAVRAQGRPAVNAAHGLAGASSAGMINAFKLIQPMKDKYPGITYAELFQLASATAIEVDVTVAQQCPHEGRLPDAGPCDPAEHLRKVFLYNGP